MVLSGRRWVGLTQDRPSMEESRSHHRGHCRLSWVAKQWLEVQVRRRVSTAPEAAQRQKPCRVHVGGAALGRPSAVLAGSRGIRERPEETATTFRGPSCPAETSQYVVTHWHGRPQTGRRSAPRSDNVVSVPAETDNTKAYLTKVLELLFERGSPFGRRQARRTDRSGLRRRYGRQLVRVGNARNMRKLLKLTSRQEWPSALNAPDCVEGARLTEP
jgi:hypothetical protein